MADRVIAYVENNPVRAGMVEQAGDFEWSSAPAHLGAAEPAAMLDREWWQLRWSPADWQAALGKRLKSGPEVREIREATYTGQPLGSKQFVADLEQRLDRKLDRRPGGRPKEVSGADRNQMALWTEE